MKEIVNMQFENSLYKEDSLSYEKIEKPKIISGWKVYYIRLRIRLTILKLALLHYKNPIIAFKFLFHLISIARSVKGKVGIKKMIKFKGKYYIGLYAPAWKTDNFKAFVLSEMNRFSPLDKKVKRFNNVFLAITKKCMLQCEHCFEWDSLNKKDVLNEASIHKIISKLQLQGVNQMYLTGGEPMLKLNTILNTVKVFKKDSDFWVLTSGYNLNNENALKLKKAGLKGVVISLDHFIPLKHNEFRGNNNAFSWVEEAVISAKKANLIVALSLCVTRYFASEFNLLSYMKLAKNWGISFVQLLEPMAVGHYQGMDVQLLPEQLTLLESFFLKMNNHKKYKEFPFVIYHGFHQRKLGCFNGGKTGLYIDTNGELNACPFCHSKNGAVLDDNFEENLEKLTANGCEKYNEVDF